MADVGQLIQGVNKYHFIERYWIVVVRRGKKIEIGAVKKEEETLMTFENFQIILNYLFSLCVKKNKR
jgi:hypothetical protein